MDNERLEYITTQFFEAVAKLGNFEDCFTFFEGLCSPEEVVSLAQRLEIAKQLLDGRVYSDIVISTDAHSLTVNRVDKALQQGGLKAVIDKLNRPASYGDFAYIYDKLTENVDYPARVAYIERLFKRYGKKPKLLLDLACGTGSAAVLFAQKGYEVIGVDASSEMLEVSSGKAKEAGQEILFINQYMQELDLYGTVDAAVCMLDGVNYITDYKKFKQVFKLMHNYLNPGGIFIFDVNTRHMLKNVLPATTITDTEDDNVLYTWESYYDDKENICEFILNFFVKNSVGYSRFTEIHRQKAYTAANIKAAIKAAGMELVGEFDDMTVKPPTAKSTKVFYVAVKP